jgi:hypothetical protein
MITKFCKDSPLHESKQHSRCHQLQEQPELCMMTCYCRESDQRRLLFKPKIVMLPYHLKQIRSHCCCLQAAHMNLGYPCAMQKLHSSAPLLLLLCTPRRTACAGLAAADTTMITRPTTSADPATSCCVTAAAELKSVRTLPPGQQSSGSRMRTTQLRVAQSIFCDSFVHC